MLTVTGLIDLARERSGLPSDYAIAKRLGIGRQVVSDWRAGRRTPGKETALELAQLARLDPGYVLNLLEAAGERRPAVRAAWERAAEALARLCIMSSRLALL